MLFMNLITVTLTHSFPPERMSRYIKTARVVTNRYPEFYSFQATNTKVILPYHMQLHKFSQTMMFSFSTPVNRSIEVPTSGALSTVSGGSSVNSSANNSLTRFIQDGNMDVDLALAKELHGLSVQDRNKVQEEVHGVQFSIPDETPQMIETSLHQLQVEIQKIRSKPAYDHAMRSTHVDGTYIQSSEFQLRFLRAVLYNVKQAAYRYTQHLNLLYEFFGEVGLQRPLRLSDLSKVEVDCLREGRRQILPSRDRSGRLIIFEKGSNPSDSRITRVSEVTTLVFS
jgi:hypothetical protein